MAFVFFFFYINKNLIALTNDRQILSNSFIQDRWVQRQTKVCVWGCKDSWHRGRKRIKVPPQEAKPAASVISISFRSFCVQRKNNQANVDVGEVWFVSAALNVLDCISVVTLLVVKLFPDSRWEGVRYLRDSYGSEHCSKLNDAASYPNFVSSGLETLLWGERNELWSQSSGDLCFDPLIINHRLLETTINFNKGAKFDGKFQQSKLQTLQLVKTVNRDKTGKKVQFSSRQRETWSKLEVCVLSKVCLWQSQRCVPGLNDH